VFLALIASPRMLTCRHSTLFGLIGATYHRIGTVMMTLTAALGTLTALVAWVLAMVLFGGYAKTSLRHNGWVRIS
jgi:hypothetical protein